MIEFFLSYKNVLDVMCINIIMAFSIYATLAAGMFALANIGFMAIGAYTSAILTTRFGFSFIPANAAALMLAGSLSFGIGRPVLKLRGDYLAVATIAFGEIVRMIILNTEPLTGGSLGLSNVPRYTTTWMPILCILLIASFFSAVGRTQVGTVVRAIRDDETVASTFAVNVTRYKLGIFMFSSILAAEAGVLSAHLNFFISPAEFTFHHEVQVIAFAIFGGVGHWLGAALGAGTLTLLPELLRGISYFKEFVIGLVILGTLIFRPYGLYSFLTGFLGWKSHLELFKGKAHD
jgi:branched-chain amino acid transport system permease protein